MQRKLVTELADVDGLGDGVAMAIVAVSGRRRIADIGRQHQDRRRLAVFPEPGDKLPAVHAGHGDVDQEQIGLDAFNQRQAVRPAGGGEDDKIEWR